MADNAPLEAGFSIILASLRSGAQPSVAAAEMARMFLLDPRVSEQILRKAPIIIFKGLTDKEIQAGKEHLAALSRFGLDFRVTQSPPVNVPKVNWPSRPDFTSIFATPPPLPLVHGAPSDHEVTAQFLCPCCGSTLRMTVEMVSPALDAQAAPSADAGAQVRPPAEVVQTTGEAEREAPPAEIPSPAPETEEGPLEPPPAEIPTPESAAQVSTPPAEEEPAPAAAPPPRVSEEKPAEPQKAMAEMKTGVALLVAENEKDHPFCEGPYDAVRVDANQEDLEYSALTAGIMLDEPLFGPRPTAPAPPSPTVASPEHVKEENLVEVEPHDASSGIEEVEPLVERSVPVPTADGAGERDPGDKEEELEPWTGPARTYKAKEKKNEGQEAEGDELQPWTGPARSYKSDTDKKKRGGQEDIPEIDPAEAADLGMDQALVADVSEKEDAEGLREGLEDLPEIKPLTEPNREDSPDPAQASPPGEGPSKKKLKKLKKKKKKKLKRPDDAGAAPEAPPEKKAPAPSPAEDKQGAKPATAADGSDYSVFLSKIVSSDRRRKAVELLTDIKGISESEAEKLTNKMIIPVVKGVSKDEAEEILDRFKKSKISGRITRKK